MRELNVSKIEETVRELCIKANLLLPSENASPAVQKQKSHLSDRQYLTT